ncbi:MAG TPA: galactitol-1-phosphate 5-dehydrogenase [Tepidisphaeraceae bacterium]|nr:galactitol-1-phosphate 5-dehydrogenase [Tepidisphaeraceae bacterium]
MKALVLKEYKKLDMVDMPVPQVGPGDVLVRVKACGICGSDVHGYDGSTGRRIPPIVMGHEAAGVVEKVGSQVTRFHPGDRVTFDSTVYCGTCAFCGRGQINLCDSRRVLGVSCGDYRQHGAFAEYVLVPERITYKLPNTMSFEQATMIEAVSIAFHAVNRTPRKLGDSAVVVGAGMIGLLVIQTLRQAGCGKLIAVDLEDRKLELARTYGADYAINAKAPDVVAQIQSLTDGRGADIAFEVVGVSPSFQTAVNCLSKGGSLTMVGNVSPKVELPLQAVVTRELTLYGSCASAGEYPACIDLIARGRIDVNGFISATPPLEEGPAWFDRLYRQEPGLMKVILKP